jgi:hypothetical protein
MWSSGNHLRASCWFLSGVYRWGNLGAVSSLFCLECFDFTVESVVGKDISWFETRCELSFEL